MFLDGRNLTELEPQGGKLKILSTVMNINTITTVIKEDCHQSVQTLATELKIS